MAQRNKLHLYAQKTPVLGGQPPIKTTIQHASEGYKGVWGNVFQNLTPNDTAIPIVSRGFFHIWQEHVPAKNLVEKLFGHCFVFAAVRSQVGIDRSWAQLLAFLRAYEYRYLSARQAELFDLVKLCKTDEVIAKQLTYADLCVYDFSRGYTLLHWARLTDNQELLDYMYRIVQSEEEQLEKVTEAAVLCRKSVDDIAGFLFPSFRFTRTEDAEFVTGILRQAMLFDNKIFFERIINYAHISPCMESYTEITFERRFGHIAQLQSLFLHPERELELFIDAPLNVIDLAVLCHNDDMLATAIKCYPRRINDYVSCRQRLDDELLRYVDDIMSSPHYGRTPLILAILLGNFRAARQLIEHPDIDLNIEFNVRVREFRLWAKSGFYKKIIDFYPHKFDSERISFTPEALCRLLSADELVELIKQKQADTFSARKSRKIM